MPKFERLSQIPSALFCILLLLGVASCQDTPEVEQTDIDYPELSEVLSTELESIRKSLRDNNIDVSDRQGVKTVIGSVLDDNYGFNSVLIEEFSNSFDNELLIFKKIS